MNQSFIGRALLYFCAAGAAVLAVGFSMAFAVFPDADAAQVVVATDYHSTGRMYVELDPE